MALTGNRGEWSEIYTLLKLLGEGVMYAGDGNLNKISDLFYPIISVIRREQSELSYSPDKNRNIVFISSNGDKLVRFILGCEIFEDVKDTALADNIHPADIGFLCMAKAIGGILKDFLLKTNKS